MPQYGAMSDLLTDFELACARASVKPTEALKRGGVHPTLWRRWKAGKSATLRNFEAAKGGLDAIIAERCGVSAGKAA
jgi:hypothetical protein